MGSISSSTCRNRPAQTTHPSWTSRTPPWGSTLLVPKKSSLFSKPSCTGLAQLYFSSTHRTSEHFLFTLVETWPRTAWGSPSAPSWPLDSDNGLDLLSKLSSRYTCSYMVLWCAWYSTRGLETSKHSYVWTFHIARIYMVYLATHLFLADQPKPRMITWALHHPIFQTKTYPNHPSGIHIEKPSVTPSDYPILYPFNHPSKIPPNYPIKYLQKLTHWNPFHTPNLPSYYHTTNTSDTCPSPYISLTWAIVGHVFWSHRSHFTCHQACIPWPDQLSCTFIHPVLCRVQEDIPTLTTHIPYILLHTVLITYHWWDIIT